MNRISITDLQRNPGELSIKLIRGEEIILTRNGKDFARLVPIDPAHPKLSKLRMKAPKDYPPFPRLSPEETVKEAQSIIDEVASRTVSETRIHKCEAPYAVCKFAGDLYEVEFQGDEGLEQKKVYLCPGHAKKARETSTLKRLEE
jgi:antitoxin (DNA-binding transcriptional repressor) of toxin-antitoxin stability system